MIFFLLFCGVCSLWRGVAVRGVVRCVGVPCSFSFWRATPRRATPCRGQGAKRNSMRLGRGSSALVSLALLKDFAPPYVSLSCFLCVVLGYGVRSFSFPDRPWELVLLGSPFSTLFFAWRQKNNFASAIDCIGCRIWRFFSVLLAFLLFRDNFFICEKNSRLNRLILIFASQGSRFRFYFGHSFHLAQFRSKNKTLSF